ncbi:MAG TPA: DUF6457 domain-containing protein [Actinopolymorphaceae bacterium]
MLNEWASHLTRELGIATPDQPGGLVVDDRLVNLVLDLARDAAHAVDRPAAPLTTFLVGYAVAKQGGGAQQLEACVRRAGELARAWEQQTTAEH